MGDKSCLDAKGRASTVAREHGGVQVTYKRSLSDEAPSYYDDEWAPLIRVTNETSSGDSVQANRTRSEGIVLVAAPPNLRSEPPREETDEKGRQHGREAIRRVLKRNDLKSTCRERAFWHALYHMHGSGLVDAIPTLPCSISADSQSVDSAHCIEEDEGASTVDAGCYKFTFTGNPRPFLPMLREIVRFPRPYITWDLWGEAPPLTFPSEPRQDAAALPERPPGGQASERPVGGLRDPDHVNHVKGRNNRQEHAAAARRLEAQGWADEDSDDSDDAHTPTKDDQYVCGPPQSP